MASTERALAALAAQLDFELTTKAAELGTLARLHSELDQQSATAGAYCEGLVQEAQRLGAMHSIDTALTSAVLRHLRAGRVRQRELLNEAKDLAAREAAARHALAEMRHRARHLQRALDDLARERRKALTDREAVVLDELWLQRQHGAAA
jgi:hypothetical protein